MANYEVKVTMIRDNGRSEYAGTVNAYSPINALRKFLNEEMEIDVSDCELLTSVKLQK